MRRRLLLAMAAAGCGWINRAFCAVLPATPVQMRGPFYPVHRKPDQDADLTSIPGKKGRAAGQVIYVVGRVLDTGGNPLPGASVEIWQANAHGRYDHPGDTHDAPIDPYFQGDGVQFTDAQGRYCFKTIKPGAYPAAPGWRAPHIHFLVSGGGVRLVTQMYFAGEPLNAGDFVLREAGENRNALIVDLLPPAPALVSEYAPGSRMAIWDIVLAATDASGHPSS